jgi:SAM-dependent methyltransferase
MRMDWKQQIQSDQYDFPYHYLPVFETDRCRLARQWNWAPSYLAALKIVHAWISELIGGSGSWSHVDVGCGDGALLFHLSRIFADRDGLSWTGVDYDESAIAWARAMNADRVRFLVADMAEVDVRYNSATLVEVAEHVPPDLLPDFIANLSRMLLPGAELLLTVPHKNLSVQPKHYQHFDFDAVRDYFCPSFEVVSMHGFARHTPLSRVVRRLILNRRYVFTWEPLSDLLIGQLSKQYPNEDRVSRIVAVLRKPGG